MDPTRKGSDPTSVTSSSMEADTSSSSTNNGPPTKTKLTIRQLATLYTICYVNFVNYMDRLTIAGILTQIQCEYNITDSEAGLISTVFVVSYMICSPVFGYLGDRYSRKILMSCGIFVWGMGTLAGSFMPNYWSFLLARIVVGVGEAMFSTVAATLISDLCVGDTRSNFLIIFYFAIPVGGGLGFIVGSSVANAAGSWRWGMRVTPILGLIGLLLMVLVVVEPKRGLSEGASQHLNTSSYWDDIKYLVKKYGSKSYMLSLAGTTLVTYVSGGLVWWGPTYFSQGIATSQGEENLNIDNVSFLFGVTTAVAGVVGVWSGSFIGQKLRVRFPTADALVCAWGMIASVPLLFWGLMAATGPQWAFYIIITFAQWCLNLNWAPSGDMLLYVVIPTRRASALAFMILISHALGDACSPYIIGVVSDAFKKSLTAEQETQYSPPIFLNASSDCTVSDTINFDTLDVDYRSLQYSMLITIIFQVLGAFCFFATAWYLVSDKAKVDRAVAGGNDEAKEDEQATAMKCPPGLVIFDPKAPMEATATTANERLAG